MDGVESLGWMASVADVADLVSAIAWPAVIVGVVWFLRAPIRAFAERVSTSAEGVSVGAQGLSIQLAGTVTHVPTQADTALAAVRSPVPAPAVVDSAALTMFAQLDTEQPAEYLAVDLGEGREWLSSRLFIFAVLLKVTRGTRVLVFVETSGGVRGRFVGLATCDSVRWALAHAFPWLEQAYARAYANATSAPPPPGDDGPFVIDRTGRLRRSVAHRIATDFVFAVQQSPGPLTPETAPPDWVVEKEPGVPFSEHASWLGGADLERLLAEDLHRFAYVLEETPGDPVERARAALRVPDEDLVALLDAQYRFRDLVVDRRAALEELAAQARSKEE